MAQLTTHWCMHCLQVASTQQEELLLLRDNGAEEEATAHELYEQSGSRFAVRCFNHGALISRLSQMISLHLLLL